MGQSKMKAEKILVSAAENLVRSNVNSACYWFIYQPELPNACRKLKRK